MKWAGRAIRDVPIGELRPVAHTTEESSRRRFLARPANDNA